MNIYIHNEMPKTGSSFIQRILKINYSWLKSKGYYYPSTRSDHESSHWFLSMEKAATKDVDYKEYLEDFIREIENSGFRKIIISEEDLSIKISDILMNFFQNNNLKIITNIRSPFSFEQSAIFFEALSFTFESKSPIGPSPFGYTYFDDGWLPRSFYSYFEYLKLWGQYFPVTNFIFHDSLAKSEDLLVSFQKLLSLMRFF